MVEDNRTEQRGSNGKFIKGNTVGFQRGESGNPSGKPRDPGITKLQIEMLDKPCQYKPSMTWREWLAERGLVLAAEKDSALEHLKERLEGKVKDEIDITEIQKIEYVPAKEKE